MRDEYNGYRILGKAFGGRFHHVSHEHLDRYYAEFDFRCSTRELSGTRRVYRLMGQTGRRLSYRPLVGE